MAADTIGIRRSIEDIKGWFSPHDQALFGWALGSQHDQPPGNLVEFGAYFGKSAILIGRYLRPGERFIVCDLFEMPAEVASNHEECEKTYRGLTRAAFEDNYLAFHPELPTVVQRPTSTILEHVAAGTCRFAHVDASHIYEHVAQDVESVRAMLRPDGIAVFDDFRAEHTPGTAAAIWEAVLYKELHPICFTRHKFYGTWGDPAPAHDSLTSWLARHPEISWEQHFILGRLMLRVNGPEGSEQLPN